MQNQAVPIDASSFSGKRLAPAKHKFKRLSDAALVLLGHAASREGGMVLPPPTALRARGNALAVVLDNLLERGLIEEVPVEAKQNSWRSEGDGWIGLRNSTLGLRAIGIEPAADNHPERKEIIATATDTGLSEQSSPPEVASIAPARPISKQDQVIALLGTDGGASLEVLMATTNWLPHTVRAALSGLRKKGHVISRRQNSAGGSVYFIEPLPKPRESVGGSS